MFSCLSPVFPAKAGIQMIGSHMSVTVWVPACAGNAGVGGLIHYEVRQNKALTQPSPTGRGLGEG